MGVLLVDDVPNVGLLLIGQWHGARLEPLGESVILGGLGALSGYKNGASRRGIAFFPCFWGVFESSNAHCP
jgi:hypothetical protein